MCLVPTECISKLDLKCTKLFLFFALSEVRVTGVGSEGEGET